MIICTRRNKSLNDLKASSDENFGDLTSMIHKPLTHCTRGCNATASVGSGPPLEVLGLAPLAVARFRVRR